MRSASFGYPPDVSTRAASPWRRPPTPLAFLADPTSAFNNGDMFSVNRGHYM
jgi:hypothetical protein